MRIPRTRRLQPLWQRLHAAALDGMNIGDSNPVTNGELWLLDHLGDTLGPTPIVFDVGANVGAYSRAVLERMPAARLFAFEPSRTAFASLEASLGKAAVVRRLALGAETAERTLYADRPGSELASLTRRDLGRFGREMTETEQVTVRRLDDVCAELEVDRINFLKVDTEGHDLDVLRGAGDMLGGRIDVIQFEFGGTAIDTGEPLRAYFDLLEPDYPVHRLLPAGLWPLEYSERIEIAVYANYVALRPPWSDRQRSRGVGAFVRGSYEEDVAIVSGRLPLQLLRGSRTAHASA